MQNPALKGRLVLVVDDEADLLEMLVESLEGFGASTIGAGGEMEAAQILRAKTPDVVVSDMRMADGSGLTILKRLRESTPNPPPFILMTGSEEARLEEAGAEGIHAILIKPFTMRELEKAIVEALAC
jgi:CheY-like chemotaxis protein